MGPTVGLGLQQAGCCPSTAAVAGEVRDRALPGTSGMASLFSPQTLSQSSPRPGGGQGPGTRVHTQVPRCLQPAGSSAGLRLSWRLGRLCRLRKGGTPTLRRGDPWGERAPTLLHQGPHPEPEAVQQSEVVFYHLGAGIAGMSIVPLVRAEPATGRGAVGQSCRGGGRREGAPMPRGAACLANIAGPSLQHQFTQCSAGEAGNGKSGPFCFLFFIVSALFWL